MKFPNHLAALLVFISVTLMFSLPQQLHAYGNNTATEQTTTHPAIQQANEARDKELRRKRLLLLFPAGVIGIIVILLIKTRHKRPQAPGGNAKRKE